MPRLRRRRALPYGSCPQPPAGALPVAVTDASLALSRLIYAEPGVPPSRADREHTLALPAGRRLGGAELGPRERVPIVYLHGFLCSRLEPGVAGPLTVN